MTTSPPESPSPPPSPPPPSQQSSPLADCVAGGSLGLLIGLLTGLSMSPVVSTVVSGLVAVLAGFFGLSEKLTPTPAINMARRLGAFSMVAAIALLAGVWMRTHDSLSPPHAAMPSAAPQAAITPQDSSAKQRATALYKVSPDDCASLNIVRLADLKALEQRLGLIDDGQKLLEDITRYDESANKDAIIRSAYFYLCERTRQ